MGQQQLLLVILVTIIVGVATVVAINVFGTSAKNANIDAVRQDILTIGSEAQGWYMKPTMLGGGGGDFANATFPKLGFGYTDSTSATDVTNANGEYVITSQNSGDSLQIEATPVQDKTNKITAMVGAGKIHFK